MFGLFNFMKKRKMSKEEFLQLYPEMPTRNISGVPSASVFAVAKDGTVIIGSDVLSAETNALSKVYFSFLICGMPSPVYLSRYILASPGESLTVKAPVT